MAATSTAMNATEGGQHTFALDAPTAGLNQYIQSSNQSKTNSTFND